MAGSFCIDFIKNRWTSHFIAVFGLSFTAFVVHGVIEHRQLALAAALRQHKKDLSGNMMTVTSAPNKQDVLCMLEATKIRTRKEKIEAAFDAANKTHEIGFPSSISSSTPPNSK